jgi:hypothetical protein
MAAVLWMRAERRCQVLTRFEVLVRVLAPSRPHQIALSTAIVYQQLLLLQLRLRLRLRLRHAGGGVWDSAGGGAQWAWSRGTESV